MRSSNSTHRPGHRTVDSATTAAQLLPCRPRPGGTRPSAQGRGQQRRTAAVQGIHPSAPAEGAEAGGDRLAPLPQEPNDPDRGLGCGARVRRWSRGVQASRVRLGSAGHSGSCSAARGPAGWSQAKMARTARPSSCWNCVGAVTVTVRSAVSMERSGLENPRAAATAREPDVRFGGHCALVPVAFVSVRRSPGPAAYPRRERPDDNAGHDDETEPPVARPRATVTGSHGRIARDSCRG